MTNMIIIKIILVFIISLFVTNQYPDNSNTKGILIWFHIMEVLPNKTEANLYYYRQSAGVSYPPFIIYHINPLSSQSKVTKHADENWFLDLAPQKVIVNNIRPIYLGYTIYCDKGRNIIKSFDSRFNILISQIQIDNWLKKHVADSHFYINHPSIVRVKNLLLKKNNRIVDYIFAVDTYVNSLLSYKTPIRPTTAPKLLTQRIGWCGEYSLLKQSLLRSAGIPTREVYAVSTADYGPAIDCDKNSRTHVWLQAYIPNFGWMDVPSTGKLRKYSNRLQTYFGEDYFLKGLAIDPHNSEQHQRKVYTYDALNDSGGIRGNGMFFPVSQEQYITIKNILNEILDYNKIPKKDVFAKISQIPENVQPILYWFLISIPSKTIYENAAKMFIISIKSQIYLKLASFLAVSPEIVKKRISDALNQQ